MRSILQSGFTSLINRFTIILLVLFLISILSTTTIWFFDNKNHVERQFFSQQNETEQILLQSVNWIDGGLILYEYTFEKNQRAAMELFLESYNKAGGEVSSLHLHGLKKSFNETFGGDWDLYIIDADGVVIITTYPPDHGLDFSKYPGFFSTLNRIRIERDHIVDRAVKGFVKGAPFRKFSYQGTPDSKYILEISQNFQKFYPDETRSYYSQLVTNLPQLNPAIVSVELFNTQGEIISQWPEDEVKPLSPETIRTVSAIFSKKISITEEYPGEHLIVRYVFLPVLDNHSPSAPMMNLVGRVIFTTSGVQERIWELTILYAVILFLTTIISLILVLRTSHYLGRPVKQLIRDIYQIAEGDLDHPVKKTGILELEQIESAITLLVNSLKEKIENLKEREEELEEQLVIQKESEESITALLHEVQEKEKLVIESEKRYRSVVETQEELISRFAPDGTQLFVNEAFCRFFRESSEEILGRPFLPYIPKDERGEVSRHFRSLTVTKPVSLNEHHIILPWGEERYVQWIDQAFFDSEGRVIEYQSVGRDISELEKLRRSLRESDILYRITVDALTDGVFIADKNHTILLCNPWTIGRDAGVFVVDEPIGKDLLDVLTHLNDAEKIAYDTVFSTGEASVSERKIQGEKEIVIETRMIPIYDQGTVTKALIILRDFTRQKEAEEAIMKLNRELESKVLERTHKLQESLEEMDAFTYSVSHDLRSPVRAIDGFSLLLMMKTEKFSDEESRHLITKIREGVQTMDRLIQDLLRFSRTSKQTLIYSDLDMQSLVRSVITELTSQPGSKEITFVIKDLKPSQGDSGLIRQVWYNLITNAIKFSESSSPPHITIGSYEKNEDIIYYIKDKGIGFDMQYAEKIFEVFSRLHPSMDTEGTGVGLALVKRIILRHQGRIWVESGIGRGTTIYFTIQGKDGRKG